MYQSAWLQVSVFSMTQEMLVTRVVDLNSVLRSHFTNLLVLVTQREPHPFFCVSAHGTLIFGYNQYNQLIGFFELICHP